MARRSNLENGPAKKHERRPRSKANGEGTIYQRGDGRWVASISLPDGKRKSYYGRTRGDVAAKQNAGIKSLRDGVPIVNERLTLGQFLPVWLEAAKPGLKPRTYVDYAGVVRLHLLPELGRRPIAKITPQDVQRLMNAKVAAGLSPRRVQIVHTVLRRALGQAVRWDQAARNVAALVDRPKAARTEVRPLTPEDAKKLLDAVRGDRLEALYSVAVAVGLRLGEALGVHWSEVGLDKGTLRVKYALQRVNGKLTLDEPKTERSRRTIVLPQVAVLALRAHRRRQWEERLLAGAEWQDSGFVFATKKGTPLEPRNVLRHFKTMLTKAGLVDARFHDLRHTCASLLLVQGVPLRVVMEILGHSGISITADTYAHVMPALERDAANRMDAALTGAI